MRLFVTWTLVTVLVFATVILYWFMAPVAYHVFGLSDRLADPLTGDAKDTYELAISTYRYLYWASCMGFILGFIVWGYMNSQSRDYDSLGG